MFALSIPFIGMAKKINVNIKGTARLAKQLKVVEAELLAESRVVIDDATRHTYALSQAKVPVQSGELKGSGRVDTADIRHSGEVAFATIEYEHEHAARIHEGFFGSDQRVAAPPKFLRDAAKEGRKHFRKALRRFFKQFLKDRFKP